MSPNHSINELNRTIFKIYRVVNDYNQRMLDLEGLNDIQPTAAVILIPLLEEEGLTLSDLAKGLHMKAPTVTVIANRLEQLGWIRRVRSVKDRRQVHLFLTKPGREKAEIFNGINRKLLQHMVTGIDKGNLKTAHETLNRVLDNVRTKLSQ